MRDRCDCNHFDFDYDTNFPYHRSTGDGIFECNKFACKGVQGGANMVVVVVVGGGGKSSYQSSTEHCNFY